MYTFVHVFTMANSECVHCKQQTVSKDRRIFKDTRVSRYCKQIMARELEIEESDADQLLQRAHFMCRRCFRSLGIYTSLSRRTTSQPFALP